MDYNSFFFLFYLEIKKWINSLIQTKNERQKKTKKKKMDRHLKNRRMMGEKGGDFSSQRGR